jgi:AcrR family transcriptional regulator
MNLSSTALERALAAGEDQSRPTPLDALRAARRMWLADQRVDMGTLARELGIGRATLYNWVGSKDRLIAEVCWSLAEATLTQARAEAGGTGGAYVVDVIARYHSALAGFAALRAFIVRDPEYALRVLACSRTPFQGRLIAAVRELLDEQVRAGAYEPPMDTETLAYVAVRIGESFIYSDVIIDTEPDLAKATEAIGVLLQGRKSGPGFFTYD